MLLNVQLSLVLLVLRRPLQCLHLVLQLIDRVRLNVQARLHLRHRLLGPVALDPAHTEVLLKHALNHVPVLRAPGLVPMQVPCVHFLMAPRAFRHLLLLPFVSQQLAIHLRLLFVLTTRRTLGHVPGLEAALAQPFLALAAHRHRLVEQVDHALAADDAFHFRRSQRRLCKKRHVRRSRRSSFVKKNNCDVIQKATPCVFVDMASLRYDITNSPSTC